MAKELLGIANGMVDGFKRNELLVAPHRERLRALLTSAPIATPLYVAAADRIEALEAELSVTQADRDGFDTARIELVEKLEAAEVELAQLHQAASAAHDLWLYASGIGEKPLFDAMTKLRSVLRNQNSPSRAQAGEAQDPPPVPSAAADPALAKAGPDDQGGASGGIEGGVGLTPDSRWFAKWDSTMKIMVFRVAKDRYVDYFGEDKVFYSLPEEAFLARFSPEKEESDGAFEADNRTAFEEARQAEERKPGPAEALRLEIVSLVRELAKARAFSPWAAEQLLGFAEQLERGGK